MPLDHRKAGQEFERVNEIVLVGVEGAEDGLGVILRMSSSPMATSWTASR